MNSVAQLLASGTVGDGETNGYYFLVNVVIALWIKEGNTVGLKFKGREKRSGVQTDVGAFLHRADICSRTV